MLQRLQNNVRKARANEGGFTLIELLLVIVILGILAGIVVFSVSSISDRGKLSACKTDRKNVEVAIETYYAEKSVYPDNLKALVDNNILREIPASTDYSFTYTVDNAATPPTSSLVVASGPAGC